MSEVVTLPGNDLPLALDDALADAIVAGTATADMPERYRSLAQLLSAFRSPAVGSEHRNEVVAVTEMLRAIHGHSSPRRIPMTRKLTVKTLVVASALTLATAGAAAAAGLPGAAQDTATSALAKIGISVPGTNDHSGDHPNTRGGSGDTGVTTNEAPPASPDTNADEIVATATDSSIVGVDKGQAVSSVASDGHSRAGTEHPASATAAAEPASPDTNADEIVAIATDSSIVGLDKGQAVSSLASDGHSQAGAEHPTSATPAGPPADVPAGPPVSTPAGPPADLPAGPPADVPAGFPAELPAGPPADVAAGPPASLPVTPPQRP